MGKLDPKSFHSNFHPKYLAYLNLYDTVCKFNFFLVHYLTPSSMFAGF